MRRKLSAVCCISLALLFALRAPSLDTRVLSESESHSRVRMTTLFYGSEPFPPAIHTHEFVLTEVEDAEKLVRGRDKSGKPWRLALPAPTRGAWLSDRGDARTYFFAGYTGGAGMAPDTWLLAISFDENGRPIPFYMTTYGAPYDDHGIKDFVDLDPGSPVLLQQNGSRMSPASQIESTVYITTAYHQRGDYWYRVDGPHGSIVFPVFERWDRLPNSQPQRVASSPDLAKLASDYGNDPQSGTEARIVGLDDHGIHTERLGCQLKSVRVIVNNRFAGRQIEVGFYPLDPSKLLPRIARRRSLVTLTGIRRGPDDGACDATILWAGFEGH